MLKNIRTLKDAKELTKAQQQRLFGGNNNPQCKYAISIDGTLCLCLGWYPNGTGTCSNRYQ
jgi:hypothetical protein